MVFRVIFQLAQKAFYSPHVADNDPVALAAIRALWVADPNAAVAVLTGAGGLLEPNVNVFADGEEDKLEGKKDLFDLFFFDSEDKLKGDKDDPVIDLDAP